MHWLLRRVRSCYRYLLECIRVPLCALVAEPKSLVGGALIEGLIGFCFAIGVLWMLRTTLRSFL